MSSGYQCEDCERYLAGQTCEAFPDGIPQIVYSGEFVHNKPYDGDNGMLYVKIDLDN